MIISNQEIAIHLHHIRNLSFLTSGRHILRLSLAEVHKGKHNKATPVCVIEQLETKGDNLSQFDQESFVSKTLSLRSTSNTDINQVFVFKLDSPVTSSKQQQTLLLTAQLICLDGAKQRITSTYQGIISCRAQHCYLQMDFYDQSPCQIVGSFHRCGYKFQFREESTCLDLKSFCQKYYSGNVQQITEYLKTEGRKNYRSLVENIGKIFKQKIQLDCVEDQEPIKYKIMESQIDAWEGQTQIGSWDDQDMKVAIKKRKQRIFSITNNNKCEKYTVLEKIMHENAQDIYQLWRDLLQKLSTPPSLSFILEGAKLYHKKLTEKTKQSVSSFKGSWDKELYGDQEAMRAKLAKQLRNKNNEFHTDLNPSVHKEFPIVNKHFFTEKRPIIFEEKACKPGYQENKEAAEVTFVLVHGLGACRLDMQKMKIELKRYYEGKIKIFVSSCNEGRTEGDIEGMGMRLASELDYQFSKTSCLAKICFIGHSMGGLIIRQALPRLEKFKKSFHSFVSLSSPHLGYVYSSSKLVDVGLWFMNKFKKCTSIMQMNMTDNQNPEKTFLYRLSLKPGLEWFDKVVFLGSHQDHYVPYYSARVQKHDESIRDSQKDNKNGNIHCKMVDNMLSGIKGSILRLDINFSISEQSLDNFIGRAAHINFINNVQMLRTFVLAGRHFFF